MNDLKYRKILSDMPTIELQRLILRKYTDNDIKDFNEYMRLDDVAMHLSWNPHLNLSETKGYVEYMRKCYRKGLPSDWAVVLKGSGKVIGNCGFTNIDLRNESCELGYVLHPAYWGKGYMDEAMGGVLKVSFEMLEAHRVYLRILEENSHSIQFAVRNGFHYDGTFASSQKIKGTYRSVSYYSMLDTDYAKNKKQA